MSCLMGVLDMMAAKKKAELKALYEKRAAFLPQFETEAEALAYARRVASLRPGDTVKVLNRDDTGLVDAVFVGTDDEGDPMFLSYNFKDKHLVTSSTSWHAVVML